MGTVLRKLTYLSYNKTLNATSLWKLWTQTVLYKKAKIFFKVILPQTYSLLLPPTLMPIPSPRPVIFMLRFKLTTSI